MLIEKIESFQFSGKLYPTEKDAITAALTEIATNIVKRHASAPVRGLIENPDELAALLTRYSELTPKPKKQKTAKVPPDEPSVDVLLEQATRPKLLMVRKFLAARGKVSARSTYPNIAKAVRECSPAERRDIKTLLIA